MLAGCIIPTLIQSIDDNDNIPDHGIFQPRQWLQDQLLPLLHNVRRAAQRRIQSKCVSQNWLQSKVKISDHEKATYLVTY